MITKLRGDREGPLLFSLQGGKTKNFFQTYSFLSSEGPNLQNLIVDDFCRPVYHINTGNNARFKENNNKKRLPQGSGEDTI